MGERRMAWAMFRQNPTFPTCYHLLRHGREFYPAAHISCDGAEAAKYLMAFLDLDDDIITDELEVVHVDEIGEHSLLLGG
jgi:hypothetical protein